MREQLVQAGTDAGCVTSTTTTHAQLQPFGSGLSGQGASARTVVVRHLQTHPTPACTTLSRRVAERREASRCCSPAVAPCQQVRIDIIVEVTAFERIAANAQARLSLRATVPPGDLDRQFRRRRALLTDGHRRQQRRAPPDGAHRPVAFRSETPYETVLERRVDRESSAAAE